MVRKSLAVAVTALALLSACGGSDAPGGADVGGEGGPASGACLEGATDCNDVGAPDDTGAPQPMGMCVEDVPDCADTVVVDDTGAGHGGGDADEFDSEGARADARALIGVAEAGLSENVRISRRGDESFALTEDYQLGRFTVELDADADGTFRVTSVVVELPDGPEAFT